MERFNALSRNGKIGAGCGGLIVLCLVCSVCSWMLQAAGIVDPPPTPRPAAIATTGADAPTEVPATEAADRTTTTPDLIAAEDGMINDLLAFDQAGGTDFFVIPRVSVDESGLPTCRVSVTSQWDPLSKADKEQLVEAVAAFCRNQTTQAGILDEGGDPIVEIINVAGRELAIKDANGVTISDNADAANIPDTEEPPPGPPTDAPPPTEVPPTTVPPTEDSTGVTLANFNKLQSGMSYEEVVAILGEEGTVLSQTDIAGFSTVMYQWFGEGSLGANMNAMFQNGEMVSKAQFGLE